MGGPRRRIIGAEPETLPFPSAGLLEGSSLFLDLDGTLLDIVDRPEDVRADESLRAMLGDLAERLDGRLAVISGRSLEQIDGILGDIASDLALSGSHGCEHRWKGVLARPVRPQSLDHVAERMRAFAEGRQGVLVEEKSYGVALHYRLNPEVESQARELAGALATEFDLYLQRGKMMVELRVAGGDKGQAIHRLMSRPPMKGTRPIFIGDDVTDEPGFTAARELGGHGVLVGPPRATAADHRIASPTDLRNWLAAAVPVRAGR
jgi:trehalose 6-phosphate phosphatase